MSNSNGPSRWLVVGDQHNEPGQDLTRNLALGRALLEERPSGIILMGDFISMTSLSSFDKKGGLRLENTRIADDVQVGRTALQLITDPAAEWNKRRHRKRYTPLVHYIEGNHEYRIKRWWEDDAQAVGTYDLRKEFAPFISSYTSYGAVFWMSGVGFTHVPFHKVGPISCTGQSVSIAQKAALMVDRSIFFAHTHVLDVGRVMRIGAAAPTYAVNVGCFFEPKHDPAYMDHRLKDWWRGVVWLDLEPDGTFDFQTVGIDRFKRSYL